MAESPNAGELDMSSALGAVLLRQAAEAFEGAGNNREHPRQEESRQIGILLHRLIDHVHGYVSFTEHCRMKALLKLSQEMFSDHD